MSLQVFSPLLSNISGLAYYSFYLIASIFFTTLSYRLFFSPLAKIPGPKIAAATGWFEFFYQCPMGGQYMFEVEKMHQKYGSIVRINPREVHISDPEFFDQLYSVTSRLDKDHWYYSGFGIPDASFGTANADIHRERRAPMNKFFSTSSVARLDPLIKDRVGVLCSRLGDPEYKGSGKPVPLSDAFRCLSADVISEYLVPEAFTNLEKPDFAVRQNRTLREFSRMSVWNRYFPFIFGTLNIIPRNVVAMLDPGPGLAVLDSMMHMRSQAKLVVESEGRAATWKPYQIILNGVWNSDLPKSDKTAWRLSQEVVSLGGAGTETTGHALGMTTFQLLTHPAKLERLKRELATITTSDRDEILLPRQLDALPYLSACIQEGLRMATPVVGRLPRVNSNTCTRYAHYDLPPGTVMSMSLRDMHFNPKIFPSPEKFHPERWLNPTDKKNLDKYFVPFGRGSRGCIGQNLAMAELLAVIGNLFHKFDMKLFETSARDLEPCHDFFSPFCPEDSYGLRVVIE